MLSIYKGQHSITAGHSAYPEGGESMKKVRIRKAGSIRLTSSGPIIDNGGKSGPVRS